MPSAARRERYKRLLGKGWPRVTMMRDKGAKSSPPWCWWLEDDGFDHEKYETETYIPVSALLSDEAIERMVRVLADPHRTFGKYEDRVRDAVQKAIEQVGGAK